MKFRQGWMKRVRRRRPRLSETRWANQRRKAGLIEAR